MSSRDATVVFMGSPEFAVPTLGALADSKRYHPVLVVTQPDRQKGRGKKTLPTATKIRATELGIPVREMSKSNYGEVVADITSLQPDVIVAVAFGIIVKQDLLELPRFGCVNVHASLLPNHRGVSPIQAAILAGDRETGCTTMLMDAGIDTGDILLTATTEIRPDDTAGMLSGRLSLLGAELLIRTLDELWDGSLQPTPQVPTPSAYTTKIKKSHGEIDWSQDAAVIERRVRAMTPWPSAFTFRRGRRLIIVGAAVSDEKSKGAAPGTVVSLDPLTVACGLGALEILSLKPEGKKAMTPQAYLAGRPIEIGAVWG